MKKLDKKIIDIKNIILIDTSYVIFYRFFALIKWFSYAYKNEFDKCNYKNYDWSTNNLFMDKYNYLFLESIKKIFKSIKLVNYEIIFCIDSDIITSWRTYYYNNYKNRTYKYITTNYNYKTIFDFTLNVLLPKITKQYNNIHTIKVNNVEADDIIGSITLWINKHKYPINIFILSNDSDFIQLGDKNIYFIDFKIKKFINISKTQANLSLKTKIIFGDKTDCIPSIYLDKSKIKKKELLNEEKLIKYLDENKKAYKQYILNKKLINFSYIPKKYYYLIVKQFKNIF